MHAEGLPTDVIIALDQGTTNTKALAIDADGVIRAKASRPCTVSFPQHGWVEQDALEIWDSTLAVLRTCIDTVGAERVAGIALSTQRESVMAWDRKTGQPVAPVLSWQDTRTSALCARLRADGAQEMVAERTGLTLDPMFSAPKIRWLLDQVAHPDVVIGTIDSWLIWKLSGGRDHLIEVGSASRTLLFNLHTLDWDDDLLELFGIDRKVLPQPRPSTGPFCTVDVPGIPRIPLLAVLADSHAALRGHGIADAGGLKVTYGTGSSIMAPTGSEVVRRPGISTTLAWETDAPVYALEGNIRYSGALLDWMARLLGCAGGISLGELAVTVGNAAGVVVVPAFGGLGAPHWLENTAGLITGLSAGIQPAHLARAAFDAIAMQVADVVEAMTITGEGELTQVHADGGASSSRLLMQIQSDALDLPIMVAKQAEVSALGVAAMAGQTIGFELTPTNPSVQTMPLANDIERSQARRRWQSALTMVRDAPN